MRLVFVDQGSSSDILFYEALNKMKFKDNQLLPSGTGLIGFIGDWLMPKGYIETQITLGLTTLKRTKHVKFAVVEIPIAYNVIFGRSTLNAFGTIVSTRHLVIKLLDDKDRMVSIRGDYRWQGVVTTLAFASG